MNEKRVPTTNDNPQTLQSRREFVARFGGAGALAALGGALLPRELLAQAKPASADLPGSVPNSAVMAGKSPAMQAHSDRPLTGSVPAEQHHYAVTPTDRMFVRNNLLTPDIDASRHRLAVKGLVDKELTFSVDELKKSFRVVKTQAMLECAGSGRTAYLPRPSGTPWLTTGGMGCPMWAGVRLREVLEAAGVRQGAVHVAGQGGDFGVVKHLGGALG